MIVDVSSVCVDLFVMNLLVVGVFELYHELELCYVAQLMILHIF